MDNRKAIELYISKLPSLSVTVTKVLEICNKPGTSPVDLNKVISLDPVLMGRVLKLINSAYYGMSQKVTSLVRAIIMLGLNTVKNLALSTAVMGTISTKNNFQALQIDGFWRHSLCVGVTSKLIAKKMMIPAQELENYFIAGLLHDIGKIPLNNRLADQYMMCMGLSDRNKQTLSETEQQSLGINHCESGAMIAEAWRLSDELKAVIQYHHTPDEYNGPHKRLLNTVIVANFYASTNEIGFSGNRFPSVPSEEILTNLGISWDFLDDIGDQVVKEIEKAQVFLNIKD